MRLWEVEPVKIENLKTYDYGVVLGGMVFYDSTNDQMISVGSIDRLIKAIELYRKGKIRKIFISGGSGSIIYSDFKEGEIVKDYLIDIGIPEQDILYETKSRNTHENALYTKKSLNQEIEQGKEILLITSSFHMRRSVGCFNKLGLDVDIFPCDRYSGPRRYQLDYLLIPNINTFADWLIIIKEIVGYVIYDIVGYI